MVSLEPQERAWLHHRVAERFDQMLAAGFVDEVRALRARGDLDPGLPSMRCVGYRQAWELLDAARDGTLDAGALALLRERGIAATRQLAKRQLTWLRGMDREVLRCDAPDLAGRAGPLLERHLGP
jgi:tRNA dimethylallyltransferase